MKWQCLLKECFTTCKVFPTFVKCHAANPTWSEWLFALTTGWQVPHNYMIAICNHVCQLLQKVNRSWSPIGRCRQKQAGSPVPSLFDSLFFFLDINSLSPTGQDQLVCCELKDSTLSHYLNQFPKFFWIGTLRSHPLEILNS